MEQDIELADTKFLGVHQQVGLGGQYGGCEAEEDEQILFLVEDVGDLQPVCC